MTQPSPTPIDDVEPQYAGPPDAGPPVYATAGALFAAAAADVDGEDHTLSSGLTVRVRPISRKANLELGKGDAPVPLMEARLLHAGLVQPAMSVQACLDFIEKAPSKLVAEISDVIRRLSGMGEGADKSSV